MCWHRGGFRKSCLTGVSGHADGRIGDGSIDGCARRDRYVGIAVDSAFVDAHVTDQAHVVCECTGAPSAVELRAVTLCRGLRPWFASPHAMDSQVTEQANTRSANVEFVHLDLLREQIADIYVVIEPVLVLTVGVVVNIQGHGLDCVPQLAPEVIRGCVLIGDCEAGKPVGQLIAEIEMTKTHLGEDEPTIHPSVGSGDHLCHQKILLVSPPDKDIISHVPVSRPGLHPGRLLLHRKVEECCSLDLVE
ncbi:unnamed protein product [Schistocephalus solidus]|uniref:Uncharacterized protein n=1 Tax=Schistocephalus solidus TaxID=70667 RepID=A0A183T246_SCHSO|nr:unnamed protein product [Schistocephalus solidus]